MFPNAGITCAVKITMDNKPHLNLTVELIWCIVFYLTSFKLGQRL